MLIVDGAPVPSCDRSIAEESKSYCYSTAHQVVIDAGSRLVVVVGRLLQATATAPAAGRAPA